MTTDAASLADQLLDAQVAYRVAELTGSTAARSVADDVRGVFDALADEPVEGLVDPDTLRATVASLLVAVGPSRAVTDLLETLPVLVHGLAVSDDHRLGDVVDRAHVEAAVDELARSSTLRREVLRRLEQSPTLAVLATRFVSALVGDAVQENRRRAERVPGVKSMLGVGDFAARQARGLAPKQLEQVLGGAADRGTQVALERVTRALVDALDEDVIREATMEIWDLHATDRVAGLRAYLSAEEVERLAATGREAWQTTHTTPWFHALVDAAVTAFLDRYGARTVREMLDAFGLDADRVVAEVERHVPGILDVLARSGHLDAIVRRRLEPFYRSEAALEILGGQADGHRGATT